jgi:hypothetical protein
MPTISASCFNRPRPRIRIERKSVEDENENEYEDEDENYPTSVICLLFSVICSLKPITVIPPATT